MRKRQQRGDGSKKKMTGTSIMPRRQDTFLRNNQNSLSDCNWTRTQLGQFDQMVECSFKN